MKDKIKAIVFDLGKVLVNYDHNIAVRRISALEGIDQKKINSFFLTTKFCQLFEEGKISPEDFFHEVKKNLHLKINFDQFCSIWNEVFFQDADNKEVCQLITQLAGKYKIALLSNTNILHFEYIKKYFFIFNSFDRIFLSYQLGFVKPDPKIYLKTIELLDISPSEIFYTDDRKDLIDQAVQLEINSFVFLSAKKLREDMQSCGIVL